MERLVRRKEPTTYAHALRDTAELTVPHVRTRKIENFQA